MCISKNNVPWIKMTMKGHTYERDWKGRRQEWKFEVTKRTVPGRPP